MSLDVSLFYDNKTKVCNHCGSEYVAKEYVFDANITHNLNKMAQEAGIYQELWRPGEIGAVYAKDISKQISIGLNKMKQNPDHYKKFDASNGWGTYNDFIPWIEKYLIALEEFPDSLIEVSI